MGIYVLFFCSQWRRLLVSPLLPPLQLLVDPEDAGVSLVVLADQEPTKVLPVKLLKSYTRTRKHAVSKWRGGLGREREKKNQLLAFAASYW